MSRSLSIFKFRALNKGSIELLVNRELWFARPDSLNDPFECPFEPEQLFLGLSQFDSLEPNVKEKAKKIALDRFNSMGICSFSRARKNQLMWAHYADEHKGFCIGFNEDLLKQSNVEIRAIDVEYQSKLPESQVLKSFQMSGVNSIESKIDRNAYNSIIGTKYTNWKYERERRLVLPQSKAISFSSKSVVSIAFGLRMTEIDKKKLRELLSGSDWDHVKWFQGEKSTGKFALDFNEI